MAEFCWNRGKTYGCSLLLAFPLLVLLVLGYASAAFCDSMSGSSVTPTLDQVLAQGNIAAHDQKMQYQKMYFGNPSSNAYLWTPNSGYDGHIQYVGILSGEHLSNTNTSGDGIVATCSTSNNCIKINQTTVGGGAGYAIDLTTAGASGIYLRNTWADTTWGKALETYSYGTVLDAHSYDSTGAGYVFKGSSKFNSGTDGLVYGMRSDGHISIGAGAAVSDTYQLFASDTVSSGMYMRFNDLPDNGTGVNWDTYVYNGASNSSANDMLWDFTASGDASASLNVVAWENSVQWQDVGDNYGAKTLFKIASEGSLVPAMGIFGDATATIKLYFNPQIVGDGVGAKPTCDASTRGMLFFTQAEVSSTDALEVCRKDNSENYAWVALY